MDYEKEALDNIVQNLTKKQKQISNFIGKKPMQIAICLFCKDQF